MNLFLNQNLAEGYFSNSQITRVLTEGWVSENVYCSSCGNDSLAEFKNNSPVADFFCVSCKSQFELKSKKDGFNLKIVDGAYGSMISRINSEDNPHFFFLNYLRSQLKVVNFIVIPKYYFVDDVIEKRKPLSKNAKRAGWIGCNILSKNIPVNGKIFYIKDGKVIDKKDVLNSWAKTSFLSQQKKENRGWLIEIMRIIDKIPYSNFKLDDMYKFESELKAKFPNNNFIKDKIRQQLQVMRDKGIIEFRERGCYSKI